MLSYSLLLLSPVLSRLGQFLFSLLLLSPPTFPVSIAMLCTNPKLVPKTAIHHHHDHGFCGSEIWTGHSGDSWSVLHHAWGLSWGLKDCGDLMMEAGMTWGASPLTGMVADTGCWLAHWLSPPCGLCACVSLSFPTARWPDSKGEAPEGVG